jgi:hypothetical protein
MAENAERGVTFLLRAKADPSSRTVIESFGHDLSSAQSQIDKAVSTTARNVETAVDAQNARTKAAVDASISERQRAVDRSIKDQQEAEEKALNDRASAIRQSESKISAIEMDLESKSLEELEAMREQRIAQRLAKEEQKYLEAMQARIAADKAYEQISDAAQKQTVETGRALSKEEIDIIKQIQKARDTLTREAEASEKRWTSVQEAESERRLNSAIVEAKKKKSVQDEQDEAVKASHEKVEKHLEDMKNALSGALLASGQLARGLAFLGLSGEKEVNRLTEGIIKLVGALDAFEGFVGTVIKIEKAYRSWTAATVEQVAAEQLLAAARAGGSAVGAGVSGATGAVQAGAAKRAGSAAAGGLVGEGVGGVAGGLAGTAVAGVGGKIAGTGPVAGALARLAAFGDRAKAFAAPVARVAGGLAARVAPPLAALAGGYALGSGIRNAWEESSIEDDVWGGATKLAKNVIDMPTFGWGSYIMGEKTFETSRDRRLKSEDKDFNQRTEILNEKNKRDAADEESLVAQTKQKLEILEAQAQVEKHLHDLKFKDMTIDEKRLDLTSRIADATKEAATGDEKSHARVIDLLNKKLETEHAIYSVQKTAAVEQENTARKLLDLANAKLESEKSAHESAKERFGGMSASEQQETIDLFAKFQQDPKSMDPEAMRKMGGLSKSMDAQIKAEKLRRADAAGFDRTLGANDVAEIAKLEHEIKTKLEVDVQAKADVSVKLTADYEAIAKTVNEQIKAQWKDVLDLMAKRVMENESSIQDILKRLKDRNIRLTNGGIP